MKATLYYGIDTWGLDDDVSPIPPTGNYSWFLDARELDQLAFRCLTFLLPEGDFEFPRDEEEFEPILADVREFARRFGFELVEVLIEEPPPNFPNWGLDQQMVHSWNGNCVG